MAAGTDGVVGSNLDVVQNRPLVPSSLSARGDTIAKIAAFLLRTEAAVGEKARELGLVLAAP